MSVFDFEREVVLGLGFFHVRAVETLHVIAVERGFHGLDAAEKFLGLGEVFRREHRGVARRLRKRSRDRDPSRRTRGRSDRRAGRKSLIAGARFSVRLPRRMVPSCVNDPVGWAPELRTRSTPAMNVVATAPIPQVSTPSFPVGGAMVVGRRISVPPMDKKCIGCRAGRAPLARRWPRKRTARRIVHGEVQYHAQSEAELQRRAKDFGKETCVDERRPGLQRLKRPRK